MSSVIYPWGQYPAPIVLTAGQSIAVSTIDDVDVFLTSGYPNLPTQRTKIGTVRAGASTTFGPYASGANITLDAGSAQVLYEVGLTPVVKALYANPLSPTPLTLNATGTLTAAMIMNGILTSTSAAAVAATLDTGAIMDTSSTWAVNESVDWSLINTGPNTVTVTASSGHTIVGTATVATVVSGRFRTRKTATSTFVTYRLA